MDVRMPDGTLIRNVPEGTTKADLQRKLNRAKLKQENPGEHDPASPEWRAKYGPTAGMSAMDKFWAGAGKSVADVGRGVMQLTGFGSREEQDEVNRLDADLMSTGAGVAGSVAGTLATTLLPAGMVAKGATAINAGKTANAARALVNPTTIRAAAAGGSLQGALRPVGTDQSRLMNTGIGAVGSTAGYGLARGIGRIAEPVRNVLSAVDERAVRTLKDAGVPLDAAQMTGSERLSQLKRFLTNNPVSSSGQVKQAERTAQGFTRAALREVGESADAADESVLLSAYQRIGKTFDDIANRNPIKADNALLNDLADVAQKSTAELEGPQAAVITRQIDEVIGKAANGAIDGKAYQNIKTTLDRISNGQNQQVGFWARELRSKLDDALQRSASADDVARLRSARTQYRNLMSIEKAVNPDGNISAAKLYNSFNVKAYGGKRAMATGKGQNDLMRLAKAGKRVLPERMPDSGTAGRATLQLLLPGALGAGYGASQGEDLPTVLSYGAGGIAAPIALQKALNNPAAARYLANGLSGPSRALLGAPQRAGLLTGQLPAVGLLNLSQQQ